MQLESAKGSFDQHYQNLNDYQRNGYPAHLMAGKFWQIDEQIYDEFLGMLPPVYCPGGFRMCENLTGDIAATYLKLGSHYWCAMTDHVVTPPKLMVAVIGRAMFRMAR